MVDLPPLLPLFLTFALALGLLMLAPEHVEYGLYAKQDNGKRKERHHGIHDLIHTYPFSMLRIFHAKHTEPNACQ